MINLIKANISKFMSHNDHSAQLIAKNQGLGDDLCKDFSLDYSYNLTIV